ncbi:MAG: PQQ-like beta-propeller repeat protein [Pirellulales bacterium]|nr:PQQ-like beta-propeller repeat protein [Pirellulales bacterium]
MHTRVWPAWIFVSFTLVVGFSTNLASLHAAEPMDWSNWRGPEQNRISREKGLIEKWNPDTGENVLWKSEEAAGISSPIVMNGKVYTQVRHKPDTREEQEKVLCLDAETGKQLWESCWNVYLSDVPAERVGWPAVVGDPETGNIYAHGVNGYFACLDGETGKTLWSRSLHEELGLLSTYGGRTHPPIVFENMVIVSGVVIGWGEMARPAHRQIAMDKETGDIRWFNGTKPSPEDTIYSTPVLTVLDGQAAMVFGSSDGAVWAFQPRTGKPIWNFRMSRRGLNVSPTVVGNRIYMSQAEENLDNKTMGALVCINGGGKGDITATNEVWRIPGVMAGKTSPLVVDGRIYSIDDAGSLYIADAETGKPIGNRPTKVVGTIIRASPLYADGKIYICSTTAWNVLKPTPDGVKSINRMRFPAGNEVSGSMAVSHGKFYLPTGGALYCLGKKGVKTQATAIPDPPKEAANGTQPGDQETAWVQVTPCEVIVRPGEMVRLDAQGFNARGQKLATDHVSHFDFELSGPGKLNVSSDAQRGLSVEFIAPPGSQPTIATIVAKAGEVKGLARIRVVSPLPWKFDFNDIELAKNPAGKLEGEVPIVWVGARHRHKVRLLDGEKVMVKVTTIPKGTRSQCWMGQDDLHDYTIQADLRGQNNRGELPDMGLIAQRYTIDLMGANQELQIRSWPPQVATRFSKTIPFSWKGDTWYTMKFRAEAKDGKAVLHGKVWSRGENEPEKWTIEATDDVANLQGSPGLFGNATNAEIYIDNLSVTPNETASAK